MIYLIKMIHSIVIYALFLQQKMEQIKFYLIEDNYSIIIMLIYQYIKADASLILIILQLKKLNVNALLK